MSDSPSEYDVKGAMNVKRRVIEYIHSLGDGGAETLVKDYARLMDKEKFEPIIVVTRVYGVTANLREVTANNIRIIPMYRHWNVFTKLFHESFGRWYESRKLARIIRENNAVAMHVHLGMLKFVRRIGPALKQVRLLYTCHNVPTLYFKGRNTEEQRAAEYLIKNNNLQMIALHQEMAKELNAMFGVDNTIVIRNGIDFKKFQNLAVTKDAVREKNDIPRNAFVIGHVGRFSEQKNHPFLVEIFKEAAQRNPDAFLLMVGAGNTAPIENKLKAYGLGDRYMILSKRSDVNELMRAMDVFVLPSLFEGLPLVMVEAQVSGLRCIASDRINPEAFMSEKTVMLPLGDAKQWADVILDDQIRGTANGTLDDYDMNKEIRRLEKLYLEHDVIE